jgi:hypothetical protein
MFFGARGCATHEQCEANQGGADYAAVHRHGNRLGRTRSSLPVFSYKIKNKTRRAEACPTQIRFPCAS